MNESYVIYPHQLLENIFNDKNVRNIVLVEEPLLFTQFAFHKKKIIFHRATMKHFAHQLKEKGFKVIYVEIHQLHETKDIVPILQENGIEKVHLFDLVDEWLEKRLKEALINGGIKSISHTNPSFYLNDKEVLKEFSNQKKFSMAPFYARQRRRFDILIENGKPLGGKWSFDVENRKKIPKNISIPKTPQVNPSPFVKEATKYVEKNFPQNYGSIDDFFYPISHQEARDSLERFLEQKLDLYGPYQDAIVNENSILFHSLLSPLINVGLLTPQEVVEKAISYAKKHSTPLNCLEGFIRQILGWREFVRGVYVSIGGKERTTNFWGHTRKLPHSFWKGSTGIIPIDNVIYKVLESGYANHIERLMVISNFMLLCEIRPDDVYRWFMELFIDAYDWVMVPNVYGMGEYADGGMITTKPYISGSNYLLKMSDYEKGPWVEIWNSLYWNFIGKHRGVFEKNPRSQPIVSMLKKMEEKTLKEHRRVANKFLEDLI